MLKEEILKEAETLNDVSVPLDSIFEAVELSEEVKTQFSSVFETTVKKYAAELAESHIQKLTAYADERYEVLKEEAETKAEETVSSAVGMFVEHLSKEWLEENKLAVDNGIKAQLFESMFEGIKELVIDHNVDLPEASVDVVAEMEDELTEAKTELAKLFEEKTMLSEKLQAVQRESIIKESTRDLTDSQKEKVMGLIEGLSNDRFQDNLTHIVEMVSKTTEVKPEETPISEDINNPEGLDYKPEVIKETKDTSDSMMDAYTFAAKKIK
ncbi:head scaffolding protein [Morganella phage vB_MmoM_MP1]|uniref:Prohead core scaffold protein n=1 Tax=Morganella phage vB_MmoM_MP1 TaxID=1852628 RepID=A0A192YC61_9CAUD|nr:head scaffolding protein [Morganella phage vB_MmoM_MP1]ANM46446.1 prohead core scaffold protein [Morganella phage vB_MmoM_MP1]